MSNAVSVSIYKENNLSQRMISKRLNCSLGKVNETLKKLKELNRYSWFEEEMQQFLRSINHFDENDLRRGKTRFRTNALERS